MGKSPSVRSLLFAALFATVIFFSYDKISRAYFSEQAEEYRFKAERLAGEGKLNQAILYYRKAIGLNKQTLAAYNGLAICYERLGQSLRAEEWYLKALEINPGYAPAHYNLGLLYEKCGRIKKAVFHWKQRWRLGSAAEPGRLKAQIKLERYAPEELKEAQAQELARQIKEQKANSARDKVLGRNRYRTKEQAMQEFYLEGMQSYHRGDYQGAAEYFHKMIEVLPISN